MSIAIIMVRVASISLTGHVTQPESIFTYFGNETYTTINENFSSFQPTFMSNRPTPPPDAVDICGGDKACVFDYALTRNFDLATSTHIVFLSNQEQNFTLGNRI